MKNKLNQGKQEKENNKDRRIQRNRKNNQEKSMKLTASYLKSSIKLVNFYTE